MAKFGTNKVLGKMPKTRFAANMFSGYITPIILSLAYIVSYLIQDSLTFKISNDKKFSSAFFILTNLLLLQLYHFQYVHI